MKRMVKEIQTTGIQHVQQFSVIVDGKYIDAIYPDDAEQSGALVVQTTKPTAAVKDEKGDVIVPASAFTTEKDDLGAVEFGHNYAGWPTVGVAPKPVDVDAIKL